MSILMSPSCFCIFLKAVLLLMLFSPVCFSKAGIPSLTFSSCDVLEGIEDFSIEGQEPVVMKWVEDKGYKLGDVMNAFRLTLVGEGKGPGMFDISAFLGKEETLRRLRKAIEVLG